MTVIICTDTQVMKFISAALKAQRFDQYYLSPTHIVTEIPRESSVLNVEIHETGSLKKPLLPTSWVIKSAKELDLLVDIINQNEVTKCILISDNREEDELLIINLVDRLTKLDKPLFLFNLNALTKQEILEMDSNLIAVNMKDYNINDKKKCIRAKVETLMKSYYSHGLSLKFGRAIYCEQHTAYLLFLIISKYIQFKKESKPYLKLRAKFKEGFEAYFYEDQYNQLDDKYKMNNKLTEISYAARFTQESTSLSPVIKSLSEGNVMIPRPNLYNSSDLIRDCIDALSISIYDILIALNNLYMKYALISNPFTSSRYIQEEHSTDIENVVSRIIKIPKYASLDLRLLDSNLLSKSIDRVKSKHCHAVLPTKEITKSKYYRLEPTEQAIYDLIIKRLLMALSNDYIGHESRINVELNGLTFNTEVIKPVQIGFFRHKTSIQSESKYQVLPYLSASQELTLESLDWKEIKPENPLLTISSLLLINENVSNYIEKDSIMKAYPLLSPKALINKVIELEDLKYIELRSINNIEYLLPTRFGINLLKNIPMKMYDPETITDMNNWLQQSIQEDIGLKEYYGRVEDHIIMLHNEMITNPSNALIRAEEESYNCPFCGSFVNIEIQANNGIERYVCETNCGFRLLSDNFVFKARTKRNIARTEMLTLISKGKLEANCVSKAGKKFKGMFKIERNNHTSVIVFELLPFEKEAQ